MVRTGMKLPTDESLRPFIYRENELTVEQGCLMWGYRVIIPAKFQHAILKELHSSHLGATKKKAYARNYFWWPKMDKDIQDLAKSCDICCTMRGAPPKSVLHPWPHPHVPWTRLHMDYLGPINGRISVFVVCDSTSKWIEAKIVKSTTAQTAIEILSDMFARFGLPRAISSDGARCFTGHEMTSFLKSHSIRHLVGAPFHPQTNGAGESAVKIVKTFLKKAISENPSNQYLQLSLNKFLSQYRNTEHAATGDSPANMLLKRKARTLFDQLLPSSNEQVSARQEEWIARGGRRSAKTVCHGPATSTSYGIEQRHQGMSSCLAPNWKTTNL
nr:uncharacterized protein K02A2.6-like [Halyomorpha halys]